MITAVGPTKYPAPSADPRVTNSRESTAVNVDGSIAPGSENAMQIANPKPDNTVLPVDKEALASAVNHIQESARNLQRSLQFSVDEDSGRTIIKVIDKVSQEVIRQIPSEEVLAMAERFEQSSGIFLKSSA